MSTFLGYKYFECKTGRGVNMYIAYELRDGAGVGLAAFSRKYVGDLKDLEVVEPMDEVKLYYDEFQNIAIIRKVE